MIDKTAIWSYDILIRIRKDTVLCLLLRKQKQILFAIQADVRI